MYFLCTKTFHKNCVKLKYIVFVIQHIVMYSKYVILKIIRCTEHKLFTLYNSWLFPSMDLPLGRRGFLSVSLWVIKLNTKPSNTHSLSVLFSRYFKANKSFNKKNATVAKTENFNAWHSLRIKPEVVKVFLMVVHVGILA